MTPIRWSAQWIGRFFDSRVECNGDCDATWIENYCIRSRNVDNAEVTVITERLDNQWVTCIVNLCSSIWYFPFMEIPETLCIVVFINFFLIRL